MSTSLACSHYNCLQTNIIIEDQIHIAGINNIRCDRLPRRTTSPVDLGFKKDQIINHPIINRVVKFCDPSLDVTSTEQVTTMGNELDEIFK